MLTIKPKTRKEIYLAYLSGDMSLELPEPLTRDEVNLYNLCKNKAYGETTTVKEVLAECQPEYDESQGAFLLHDTISINAGEKYTVRLNGVDYVREAEAAEEDMIRIGGESDVFMMDVLPDYTVDEAGFVAAVTMNDGSTTLTISIRQEVTEVKKIDGKYVAGMGYEEDGVVHTIDPKFLPSGGGGGVVFVQAEPTYEWDGDYCPATCELNVHEIAALIKAGTVVYLVNGSTIYGLSSFEFGDEPFCMFESVSISSYFGRANYFAFQSDGSIEYGSYGVQGYLIQSGNGDWYEIYVDNGQLKVRETFNPIK